MYDSIQARLNYQFTRSELLVQALTHKSITDKITENNERLEFLGDAVLQLALSEYLISQYPEIDEGQLTVMRSHLVDNVSLSEVAAQLQLHEDINVGRGEARNFENMNPKILSRTLEAIVGAVYLDSGYGETYRVILHVFKEMFGKINPEADYRRDFKTLLQEQTQKDGKGSPNYILESEEGLSHSKVFKMRVESQGQILATGEGRSKKAAEQEAARKALEGFRK